MKGGGRYVATPPSPEHAVAPAPACSGEERLTPGHGSSEHRSAWTISDPRPQDVRPAQDHRFAHDPAERREAAVPLAAPCPQWQAVLPESVKVLPASGTNVQS